MFLFILYEEQELRRRQIVPSSGISRRYTYIYSGYLPLYVKLFPYKNLHHPRVPTN